MTIAPQFEQKSIEKSERDKLLQIARAMLRRGMDRDTVMFLTGLSEDDLARIRH